MVLFESEGSENTNKTVELTFKAAIEKNIQYIVVASNTGNTAKLFKDRQGIQVVCVTHANGTKKNGENELSEDMKNDLANSGLKILTTTHVLSGAERAISRRFSGAYPLEIIAQTLKLFGQGTKVGVEIAVMALDAGLIPYGEKVIAVGGTKGGADTALILTPAHANNIFDTRIHEIICKPV